MRSAERETSRNELLSNANETRVLVTERSDSAIRMCYSEYQTQKQAVSNNN